MLTNHLEKTSRKGVRCLYLHQWRSEQRVEASGVSKLNSPRVSAIFLCLLAIYLYFSVGPVLAADCRNLWTRPSSQTMSMDSSISFELVDFKNGERYFSIRQNGGQSVDVFFLKGAVLVKGYSQAQIDKISENAIFWMPMVFAVPAAVLSEAVPKGPCTIKEDISISVPLTGAIRLQDRELTKAAGLISPSTTNKVSYQLDVSIDPPAPNKSKVNYSGTMSFAPQQESPADETDVSGYLLLIRERPYPSAGESGIPGALGELRRYLETTRKTPSNLSMTQ